MQKIFADTIKRVKDSIADSLDNLGHSKEYVLEIFLALGKKLEGNPTLKSIYIDFISTDTWNI